ncbi:MAG: response regulator [Pedobacter sp.]|uniref:response regulator n=1 Tax=Pedobacter sp. TaxID=1411316 RepID=UPI0035633D26
METIFIQDNDEAVLDVLQLALRAKGFQVFTIQDFKEGFLDTIDRLRPHVVMLDYKLSGQGVMEIFMKIKQKYPHLPIIALSCNYNIREESRRLGFDDYIRKPFDLSVLYEVINKHI